jgi:hypothetical protein
VLKQNLAQELRFYLDLYIPIEIIHLPSLEVDPYRGLSLIPRLPQHVPAPLWQLLQDGPKVLIASVGQLPFACTHRDVFLTTASC